MVVAGFRMTEPHGKRSSKRFLHSGRNDRIHTLKRSLRVCHVDRSGDISHCSRENRAIEQSVSSLRRLLAFVATDVCADQDKYSTAAMKTNVPIACKLSVLDEEEQQRRQQLASTLRDAVREIIPASNGYTFRFAEVEADLREVAEFISLERRCCPFLEFQLEARISTGSRRASRIITSIFLIFTKLSLPWMKRAPKQPPRLRWR